MQGNDIFTDEIWSYDNSGAEWCCLCKTGLQQSPINLTRPLKPSNSKLKFGLRNVKNGGKHFNNGDYIEFLSSNSDEPLGFFQYKGTRYFVEQIHFHTLSEHTINNVRYPLEMHIVGKTPDEDTAVLGILWDYGKHSKLLENIGWTEKIIDLPPPQCDNNTCRVTDSHSRRKPIEVPVNKINLKILNKLLKDRAFYHYNGSLTTPKCTEGVKWFVFAKPLHLSDEQLSYYHSLIVNSIPSTNNNSNHNNRILQNRNGRVIKYKA